MKTNFGFTEKVLCSMDLLDILKWPNKLIWYTIDLTGFLEEVGWLRAVKQTSVYYLKMIDWFPLFIKQ